MLRSHSTLVAFKSVSRCFALINLFCTAMKFLGRVFKYFGGDKIVSSFNDVSANGGLIPSIKKLYRMETFRSGKMIGEDKYGNKYYEDPSFFYGRNRWVEYAKHRNLEYDASQVPSEWHGWLHYMTDFPPHKNTAIAQTKTYKWIKDHSENLSGTKNAYMPYDTTRPKIQGWNLKQNQ